MVDSIDTDFVIANSRVYLEDGCWRSFVFDGGITIGGLGNVLEIGTSRIRVRVGLCSRSQLSPAYIIFDIPAPCGPTMISALKYFLATVQKSSSQ